MQLHIGITQYRLLLIVRSLQISDERTGKQQKEQVLMVALLL